MNSSLFHTSSSTTVYYRTLGVQDLMLIVQQIASFKLENNYHLGFVFYFWSRLLVCIDCQVDTREEVCCSLKLSCLNQLVF